MQNYILTHRQARPFFVSNDESYLCGITSAMSESKNYLETLCFLTATLRTQRESIGQGFPGERPTGF
jgi:hypothetical protein